MGAPRRLSSSLSKTFTILCLLSVAVWSTNSSGSAQSVGSECSKNVPRSASSELAEMFTEDQIDRSALDAERGFQQWQEILVHDKAHHARVLELIHQGGLQSAEDYYHAAMIMQHGNEPTDFMLAHILATAAALKGSKPAKWLSAASFDRLMQKLSQPQIFGTQYFRKMEEPYTMNPIKSDVISDQVRNVFSVPTLLESKERLKQLNSESK